MLAILTPSKDTVGRVISRCTFTTSQGERLHRFYPHNNRVSIFVARPQRKKVQLSAHKGHALAQAWVPKEGKGAGYTKATLPLND